MGSPTTTRRITERSSVRPSRSCRPAMRAFSTRARGARMARLAAHAAHRRGVEPGRAPRRALAHRRAHPVTRDPSSRERSVAAVTASRSAPRIPPCSSAREPGSGRAARRRDRGAQRLRSLVAVDEQRRRAEHVCSTSVIATSRGRPFEHPALDERLCEEEDVRRSRAGEAGDRVEHPLGDPDDDPDRAEQPLGQLEVRLGRRRRRRRSRTRPCARAPACSAWPGSPAARAPRPRARRW